MQTVQNQTSRKAPSIEVTDCEVIARIGSQSNPSRKPYETYVNRYTAKGRCDCLGYRTHKHCSHLEALTAVALEQNLIIKVRKGTKAEPRLAVIDDHDPYADLAELAEKQLAQSQAAFEEVFPELAQVIREEEEALIARYAADQDGHAFRLEQIARWNLKGAC